MYSAEAPSLLNALKVIADDTRARILALLADGELCVCHLETALDLSQPTVSRNLAILRHAGLVIPRRAGNWIHYRLAPPPGPATARVLAAVVAELAGDPALAADRERLARVKGGEGCR